jgi:hypothetical protein
MQQAIETIRKKTYSTINNGTTTSSVSVDTAGTPTNIADDLSGTQTVTITTPNAHYKKILVQIVWQESFFGKSKNVGEYCGTFISDDSQAN